MQHSALVHVRGQLTSDTEFRFTERGTPVARFLMLSTERTWNTRRNAWQENEPLRYMCTLWRAAAEHAAESLTRGVHVVVTGRLTAVEHDVLHISVDDIGVSLHDRIVYTETSLPGPQAAGPQHQQPAPPPPPEPAAPARAARPARTDGRPPDWWHQQRGQGWYSTAQPVPDRRPEGEPPREHAGADVTRTRVPA
ncbi:MULTISPECIES: single-stranded DNA-binding protein [unclassified Streptomyces]|uniref:single-stranded DNA-binding protein n=1 Tax=unclassified Streptomyces TaxID=2593676 RepID=UPI002DDB1C46|nr:single-stranded DNA-binding protein [Streptomyces sp. NBC_01795]WSA97768.1 single-stranded DNA-binding protein [Streptomyces sp. NBC_01795]WSS46715.1 single-stranded DNA-binding protein [Streptomyces sp. NBC_01187]WSS47068.1 single-stranded DNA-binding protein [Streptomyces sp. NBC_01187]